MEQGNERENQASNLKKILADINAQEKDRKSLLSDDELDTDLENTPLQVSESNDDDNLEENLNLSEEQELNDDLVVSDGSAEHQSFESEDGQAVDIDKDAGEGFSNSNDEHISKDDTNTVNDDENFDKSEHIEKEHDLLANNNESIKSISPLQRKSDDYVPYGHYEEVTNHSEDVVFYDSDQFQQYVQRRMESEDNRRDNNEQGVISKKIQEHSEISNVDNLDVNSSEEDLVNFSKEDLEVNTLNLPPRREVHRNSPTKMSIRLNKPLLGFVALIMLTTVAVISLFLVGGDEVIELFELNSLFNFFL